MTQVVDCHAHYEPRMLDVPTALAKMDAVGVKQVALVPAMNGPIPKTPEALLSLVRFLMQRRGTRRLAELVHRSTLTRDGNLKLHGQVIPIYQLPDNDAVARVLELHPDRFQGWIFLNPRADAAVLDTLERYRAVDGFVGVKLHPHWHDYRTELLDPVLQRCEELGLPALVHLGFGARGDFRAMLQRHPRLKLISAHAGFPFFQDLWRYAGDFPNLYVDLSSPYLNEALVRRTVAAVGPERCLYGTDAPYGFEAADHSYDYGEIKGWVERLPLSSVHREAILGSNYLSLVEG